MWRVNTSKTQARQIDFSTCVTDSGGSADTSSGLMPAAGLRGVVGRFFAVFGAGLARLGGMPIPSNNVSQIVGSGPDQAGGVFSSTQ
jgi:hypothetical protein